jgi:hypothetical protein
MAEVTKITKKIRTSLDKTLKYQILTYCFFNDIQISNADLNCLALLGLLGEHELTDFCKIAVTNDVFKSPQSARNAVNKATKKGLISKNGNSKKSILLSKKIQTSKEGVVLLDFKILGE